MYTSTAIQSNRSHRGCEAQEYRLAEDLRRVLTLPSDAALHTRLTGILHRLLDNRSRQVQLVGAGEYQRLVVEASPRLHRQVQTMKLVRYSIFSTLGKLSSRLTELRSFEAVGDELHSDLDHWVQSLAHHRENEAGLFHDAFALDLGGEG